MGVQNGILNLDTDLDIRKGGFQMPRFIGRLSELKVRNSKPPNGRRAGLLADGGNLYLQVSVGEDGNIRRSWVFKFQPPCQPQRDMGLRSIHDIGLADAQSWHS